MLERLFSFNFHPPLASFPFALLSLIVILELILLIKKSDFLEKAVCVNIVAVTIAIIATFFSGYQAESLHKLEDPNIRGMIEFHHNLGRLLLFSSLACLISYFAYKKAKHNKTFFRIAYYLILILCFVLVLFTGYIGGDMVFSHGVGVKRAL